MCRAGRSSPSGTNRRRRRRSSPARPRRPCRTGSCRTSAAPWGWRSAPAFPPRGPCRDPCCPSGQPRRGSRAGARASPAGRCWTSAPPLARTGRRRGASALRRRCPRRTTSRCAGACRRRAAASGSCGPRTASTAASWGGPSRGPPCRPCRGRGRWLPPRARARRRRSPAAPDSRSVRMPERWCGAVPSSSSLLLFSMNREIPSTIDNLYSSLPYICLNGTYPWHDGRV